MKEKVVATNKKALRDYEVFERYEAGILLQGSEVKSLRQAKCSLDGSFCRIENGEPVCYNIHIPEYEKSSIFKHNPKREKRLLLRKRQINYLAGRLIQRGYTLIPLRLYFSERGWVKVEIGLCKGRRKYEKRQKLKEKDVKREIEREISRRWRRS